MSENPFVRRVCVCVPARNEADRLPRLLRSLAVQNWPEILPVVVTLNNTTDGSRDVVERIARELRSTLSIHIDERNFTYDAAHAGSARRRAMDIGADLLGEDYNGVLITTDADARPPLDWVGANLAAINRGVDLVGGALVLDNDERISPLLRSRWGALSAYWRAVRLIEDEIDPVSWDPSPRHGDHTGGSLAATVAAYRGAGGVPAIPSGEDAAFVSAARSRGYRLSHPIDVWTRVSARTEARAAGGMATKMVELAAGGVSAMAVPSLERWRERARWRRDVRLQGGDAAVAEQEALLPPMPCDVLVTPPTAEAAA